MHMSRIEMIGSLSKLKEELVLSKEDETSLLAKLTRYARLGTHIHIHTYIHTYIHA